MYLLVLDVMFIGRSRGWEWRSLSTVGLGIVTITGRWSTLREKVASWSFQLIVVLITLDERIVQVKVGLLCTLKN